MSSGLAATSPAEAGEGRPTHDHRTILNGILWLLRTGSPWRDLPERFGPWQRVASRFYRWRKAGIWDQLWVELQRGTAGRLDWDMWMAGASAPISMLGQKGGEGLGGGSQRHEAPVFPQLMEQRAPGRWSATAGGKGYSSGEISRYARVWDTDHHPPQGE